MVSSRSKNSAVILMITSQLIISAIVIGVVGSFVLRPSSVNDQQSVIVLCVYSEDTPPSTSIGDIQTLMDDVCDYFTECSYSQVQLSSDEVGWVKLSKPMSSYASEFLTGSVEHGCATDEFVLEAITRNDPLVDFTRYDRLVIVHSGHGRQEYTFGNSSHVGTCHKTGWYPTSDGRIFQGVSIVSEFDSMGSYAHELGHDFGAVDLYDYQSNWPVYTGISRWGIMSGGSKVHMCVFNKLKIGWIDGSDIFIVENGGYRIDLVPVSHQDRGYRVIRYNLPDGRYYLVEARSNSGYDTNLPDYGVLIMLVNESRLDENRDAVQLQIPLQSSSLGDASLREGETYFHVENHFAVKVVEWTETAVTVEVGTNLEENWIISERLSIDSGHSISKVLVTTTEADYSAGGFSNPTFAAAFYRNDTSCVTNLYRSDNSGRDWQYLASTNRSGFEIYEYGSSFCYYQGLLFLVGRISGSSSSFLGSITYSINGDSFGLTNLTQMIDYSMWDVTAVSGRESLYICGASRLNTTQGITYIRLRNGLWNTTFQPSGTYFRVSNVVDENNGPFILAREDINFTLSLTQFNSTDILHTWRSSNNRILGFDIACSREKVLVAYHDGIWNETYASTTLHVIIGSPTTEFQEIYDNHFEGRRDIEAICYKNSTDTLHILEWTPGNLTDYVIQEESVVDIRTMEFHSFAVSKFDAIESENMLLLFHEYNSALHSTIWSLTPSIIDGEFVYYIVNPIQIPSPVLIASGILGSIVVFHIIMSRRRIILSIYRGRLKYVLDKGKQRLLPEHISRIRLFLVRPRWMLLNVLITVTVFYAANSTFFGIITSMNVALANVLGVEWSLASGIISLFFAIIISCICVFETTELEITYTRSTHILNILTTNLEQLKTKKTDTLNNILKLVHSIDFSIIQQIAYDDLLYDPESNVVQDIQQQLSDTVCEMCKGLNSDLRTILISQMESLYPDFAEKCESESKPLRFWLIASWNLHRRRLLLLISFIVAFPIILWFMLEDTVGIQAIIATGILVLLISAFFFLFYHWIEIKTYVEKQIQKNPYGRISLANFDQGALSD